MLSSFRPGVVPSLLCLALAGCGELDDEDVLDQAEVVNNDPDFIQVYVNNVENLEVPSEQCPGDWRDLLHYIDRQALSPDLFLLQQVSDRAQLNRVVDAMSNQLHGRFEGIIADGDPKPFNSPCGPAKDQQTNAIIYRAGRFEPVGAKHTWRSWRKIDGACRRDPIARTLNVMQKFRDKRTGKRVTAASLHWSTTQGCAEKNIIEADQKLHMAGFGGALVIMGGDMNEPDRRDGGYLPWYARVNGQLGGALNYRDPIFTRCRSTGATKACLDDEWTIGSARRIDFLLTQNGSGAMPRTSAAHTITFAEADRAAKLETGGDSSFNYSDHRAIRARIHY